MSFALEENRKIVVVHLQRSEVPGGLRLSLNNRQAILAYETTPQIYRGKILSSVGAPPVSSLHTSDLTVSRSKYRWLVTAIAVIAIVVTTFFAKDNLPSDISLTGSKLSPEDPVRLIVFPFQSDEEHTEHAAVFASDIQSRLARIESLIVVRLDTHAWDDVQSQQQRASELSATHYVTSTVNVTGTRTQIDVTLADASNGETLWTQRFENDINRQFGTSRDITLSLARELNRPIDQELADRLGSVSIENMAAMRLYQRARGIGAGPIESTNSIAIEFLHEAVSLEPGFVDAHALLGRFYRWNHSLGVKGALELAEEHTLRALALDVESAEAHAAMGDIHLNRGQTRLAAAAYRKAVLLKPSIQHALQDLSVLLTLTGELEEALELATRAVRIRPTNTNTLFHLTIPLIVLDPARTTRLVNAALNVAPVMGSQRLWGVSMWLALQKGDLALAQTRIESMIERGQRLAIAESITAAAWGKWVLDKPSEATQLLTDLHESGTTGFAIMLPSFDGSEALRIQVLQANNDVGQLSLEQLILEQAYNINDMAPDQIGLAGTYAMLGDFDTSLAHIDQAHDLGFRAADALVLHPAFAHMLLEPGFIERTERMRRDVDRMKINVERDGLFEEIDQIIDALERQSLQAR